MSISTIEIEGYETFENVVPNKLFNDLSVLATYYIERAKQRQNNSGNIGLNLFRTENLLFDFPLPELINIDITYNVIKRILGERFILKEIYIYFSLPNNGIQELHKDGIELFSNTNLNLPPHLIVMQFPLVDFNSLSGGTRIVAGSQFSSEEPTRLENENLLTIDNITPEVKKQGCILRNSQAWHGAGINSTNETRAMYTLSYAKNWFGSPTKVSKDLYFCIDKDKRHLVTLD